MHRLASGIKGLRRVLLLLTSIMRLVGVKDITHILTSATLPERHRSRHVPNVHWDYGTLLAPGS